LQDLHPWEAEKIILVTGNPIEPADAVRMMISGEDLRGRQVFLS
jgi:hypothetical protein